MSRLGGLSRRRGRRWLNAEVNVINLVDVVLVVLIIFMVTAPMLQGGIKVNLPRAAARPMDLEKALVVTVQPGGRYSVGTEDATSFDRFKTVFRLQTATRKPESIAVRGDRAAVFEDVARVLDFIQASGFRNVGLVTQAGGDERQ